MRLRAMKVVVPDPEQGHQHRNIIPQRRGGKVSVHCVCPSQQLLKVILQTMLTAGQPHSGK